MSENHTYSQAAGTYSTASATEPRSLEAHVLLKAAQKLETLANRFESGEDVGFRDVGETLEYNQKLWALFTDDAQNDEHPLPQDIKNNIASLGLFVFKHSRDILIEPTAKKLHTLVSINRNIANGLKKQAAATEMPAASDESTQQQSTSTVL